MSLYSFLYKIVGTVVLILGLIMIPLLPLIIKEDANWDYLYVIYICQLIGALCTYFLAYKRIIFTVSQQNFKCIKVDTVISVIGSVCKIIAIVVARSYIAYLLVALFQNLVANIVISRIADKEFPYISKRKRINIKDFRYEMFFKDFLNNFIQKICLLIYGGTDNILITFFLGVKKVALVSNYNTLGCYATSVIEKITSQIQASIGDMVNKEGENQGKEAMFNMFDRLSFFVACFVSTAFVVLFQNAITVWLGEAFLVPMTFVLAYATNQYIAWNHKFLCYYRGILGHFEIDRNYIVAGAIANIIFSIVFVKPLGVAGIIVGTCIGHIGFWIGRAKVVFKIYLKNGLKQYVYKQIVNVLLAGIEVFATYLVTMDISNTLYGLVFRLFLCLTIPNCINLLIFWRTSEMTMIRGYVRIIALQLKTRLISK